MKGISVFLWIFLLFNTVKGEIVVWTGLADNNSWSSPANWKGNTVPGWEDVAVFEELYSGDCYLTNDTYVKGIMMRENYTGEISVQAYVNVMLGDMGLTIYGGRFDLNNGRVVNYGSFIQTYAGEFISLEGIVESPDVKSPSSINTLLCENISFYNSDNKNYHKTLSPLIPVNSELELLLQSPANVQEVSVYFDNLGRTEQRIARQSTPQGKDLVTFSRYDQYSKEPRVYLPYVTKECTGLYKAGNVVNDQINYYTSNPDPLIAKVEIPMDGSLPVTFSERIYEPSPENRIIESAGLDQVWKYKADGTGKTLKIIQRFNKTGEVIFWNYDKISGGAYARNAITTSPVYYDPNTLMVTERISSGNLKTIEYKNLNGQLLLTKSEEDINEWREIYYVYDRLGKIRYVIPPMATFLLNKVNYSIAYEDSFTDNWLYAYKYDARGRLTEKKAPGIEKESYVYDRQDKLVLTQNGEHRVTGKWAFVKYDALQRPVLSGIIVNASSRLALQNEVDNFNVFTEHRKISPVTENYSNNAFPVSIVNNDILTVNYYDDYDVDLNGTSNYSYVSSGSTNQELILNHTTQGLQTLFKERNLKTWDWLERVSFYDRLARPVQQQKSNHLFQLQHPGSGNLTNILTSFFNFQGQMIASELTVDNGSGDPLTIGYRTVYYSNGKPFRKYLKCNNGNEIIQSEFYYNEIGQLTDKKIHSEDNGNSFLQSVDYRYNIRGWLTSVNNSQLTNDMFSSGTNDDSDDLFGLNIYREQNFEDMNVPQVDGKVSAVRWKINNTLVPSLEKAYLFRYSKTHALESAEYLEKKGVSWLVSDRYKESNIKYDKNGNITKLRRYSGSGSGILIDDLSYHYNGNKLSKIDESSNIEEGYKERKTNSPIPTFVYNANGRIKEDNQQQLKTDYNLINLPVQIYNKSNTYSVSNNYTASGTKLTEIFTTSDNSFTKHFTEGITVEGENDLYFYTPEGRVIFKEGIFHHEYALQDHIGNVRVMFDKGPDGRARLIQENNFYPFGMFHNDAPAFVSGSVNQVSYGGKEYNPYTKEYDFGARNYNPSLGRWTSYDPLAEKEIGGSPFAYCLNDPAGNFDPDGKLTHSEFLYGERQNIVSQDQIMKSQFQTSLQNQWMAGTPEGLHYAIGQQIYHDITTPYWAASRGGGGGKEYSATSSLTNVFLNMTPIGGAVNSIMNFRSGDNLGGFLNLTAVALDLSALRGAVTTAKVASGGTTLERGVVNGGGNTTTIYRNFGTNEFASIQMSGEFSITGRHYDGKQFWFTKEGVNWWESTSFRKTYTAEVVVPSSIVNPKSSSYLFNENPALIDNYPAGTVSAQNMSEFNSNIISIKIYQVPQHAYEFPMPVYPVNSTIYY